MSDSNRNGVVIYRGPSLLDGAPIAVVLTGLANRSANPKTGDMLQTWIGPDDGMFWTDARRSGSDASVCGSCVHRPLLGGDCYVNGRVLSAVSRCLLRGGYRDALDLREVARLGAGRQVRLGAWGDPAAVPVHVWQALVASASDTSGYTHQWLQPIAQALQGLCMASADSPEERDAAQASGWRTFRVAVPGDSTRARGEARCPASAEAGQRTTCESCPLKCNGGTGLSIVIQAH